MKKNLFIISIAILALFGCSKDELVDDINVSGTITAKFENTVNTKVAVGSDNSLAWTAGDAFTVFPKQGTACVYNLQGNGGTSTGTFTGTEIQGEIYGAAYPFIVSNAPELLGGVTLNMNLPSELTYSESICNSPMWADGSYGMTSLSFKHLVSLLKVDFVNIPSTAGQLIITASKPLSGKFSVSLREQGDKILSASTNSEEVSNKVVVKFNAGSMTNALFLIPIPVNTYESFAVSYANADGTGETCVKYWSNLTFERAIPNATSITLGSVDATLNTDYTISQDGATYTINTPAGLFWFANEVNTGNNLFSGKTVVLGDNIDLNNIAWTPIGSSSTKDNFHGTFDGNNKTISNLKVNIVDGPAGLFGYVQNCVSIKNVNIKGVDLSSNHYAGSIAGWFQENGSVKVPEINNCSVEGGTIKISPNSTSTGYDNGDKAGGIVGYAASDVKIKNCSVKDLTITGYRDLGGILGAANSSSEYGTVELSGCNVEATALVQDLTIQYKDYIPTTLNSYCGRIMYDLTTSSNSGSVQIIVEIANAAALKTFANTINAYGDGTTNHHDFFGKVVKVTDNIDLNNEEWTPIGKNTTDKDNFLGIFDGNNKTISNLKITSTTVGAGLFGYIKAGAKGYYPTIKNVKVSSVDIKSSHYAGGVIGYALGVTLTNCSTSGGSIEVTPVSTTINGESKYDDGDKAGGVVGWIQLASTDSDVVRTTMTNCSATGLNITAYRDFGGVAGYVKETASTNQFKSNSAAEITLTSNRDTYSSNYNGTPDMNAGEIVGRYASSNTLDNSNTSTNVVVPN